MNSLFFEVCESICLDIFFVKVIFQYSYSFFFWPGNPTTDSEPPRNPPPLSYNFTSLQKCQKNWSILGKDLREYSLLILKVSFNLPGCSYRASPCSSFTCSDIVTKLNF